MRYRMKLASAEGRVFSFEGFKLVHDDKGLFDPWSDTTTLFVTVWDEAGDVAGKGILRIATRDFLRQMRTMEVTGARGARQRLAGLARFNRYFAGSMVDVYGGVFSRSSAFDPDAEPRKRRELRVEEPEVEEVATADGARVRLARYQGGDRGPVVLAHGLGSSSAVFAHDTIETNLVEYLVALGYDTWLLDWRGSSELGGAASESTLDDVAANDWPAAIGRIREVTGADGVHAVAEGVGSLTLQAALLRGLEGVASVVAIGLGAEVSIPHARRLGRGLRDADGDLGREDLRGRIADGLLKLQPTEKEERCASAACRRATYVYGLLYEHDRLNRLTHETIHELVALPSRTMMEHLKLIGQKGRLVDAAGGDTYLPALERLALPITFLHGAESAVFRPEGTEKTVSRLRERFGGDLVAHRPIPDYGHLDCLIGKDAVVDVYPLILDHLDKTASTTAVAATLLR
jgi:cholesterol oxidase